jgi:hypothetical protein
MIQKILILAIAGLTVAYLLNSSTAKEEFTSGPPAANDGADPPSPAADHPAPAVTSPEDDDPRDIPWIASWSAADRAARRGQNCLPTYTEAGPHGTTILTTAKSCEAGMPHTRAGDRIVIPDSVTLPARATTIAHELVHIHQRRNPDAWRRFYARAWSFQFAEAPPTGLPAAVAAARRGNPDTWYPEGGGPWACWMGRWWPMAIYRRPDAPNLRDADVIWWDSWRSAVVREPPLAWIQFFGAVAQPEHPHEIAACIVVAADRTTEAGRRLLDWWESTAQTLW